MNKLIFTLDLEDHTKEYNSFSRYMYNTELWLEFLQKKNVLGTFFVVAQVARKHPDLVRKIYDNGHEIASHSLSHQILTQQNPESFYETEKLAKNILEQTIGDSVKGFRAPVFSLTKKTSWTLDVLHELGYSYSSSVIPVKNPVNGYPEISRSPFKWSNGIVEFPCPIASFKIFSLPYLGGIYIRYIPLTVIKIFNKINEKSLRWIYVHPYDIDFREKFYRFENTGRITSFLLWRKRKNTFNKVDAILDDGASLRFCDLLENDDFMNNIDY